MLRQFTPSMTFETQRRELMQITRPLQRWVAEASLASGLLTLFVRHRTRAHRREVVLHQSGE